MELVQFACHGSKGIQDGRSTLHPLLFEGMQADSAAPSSKHGRAGVLTPSRIDF